MAQAIAAERRSQAVGNDAIRPFRKTFPEADVVELRRRIDATIWPDRETVADASQGVQLATVQRGCWTFVPCANTAYPSPPVYMKSFATKRTESAGPMGSGGPQSPAASSTCR